MNNYVFFVCIILIFLRIIPLYKFLKFIDTYVIFHNFDKSDINNLIMDKYIINKPKDIQKIASMTDKYLCKNIVKNFGIRGLYIPKTYSYVTSCKDIKWETIPDKFVIKPTHLSGVIKICKGKCEKNIKTCTHEISQGLKRTHNTTIKKILHKIGIPLVEHHYELVKPGIIIEEYIPENDDWKFIVYNGKVKLIYYIINRGKLNEKKIMFDNQFNIICNHKHLKINVDYIKLKQMKNIAEELAIRSIGEQLIRVDLYLSGGKIYFGELTFTSGGGRQKHLPEKIL